MKNFISLIGAVALGVVAPQFARADTLVELYTSQGCSSCPPADELLGKVAQRPDVIALSLHVDYWDYLGWKDSFSQAAFTGRQRDYAQTAGSSMIYTPQLVIGGTDFVVGSKGMEVMESLMRHAEIAEPIEMGLARDGDQINIEAKALGPLPSEMVVYLAQYTEQESVSIKRGENAGREITYHNVVKNWGRIGVWDGAEPLALNGSVALDMPVVVIIQDGVSGPVLAAERIE